MPRDCVLGFRKRHARLWLGAYLLAMTALLASCSFHMGVKPWEREILAQESMTMDGLLDDDVDDHIYFSKEASSGGRGFGGGGCGCN